MQDTSTKALTVDEIINLAAAWHYLIWNVDKPTEQSRGSSAYTEIMTAVPYARQTLKLTPTQTSIFLTKVSQLANPHSPLNSGYWDLQHAKYVAMYEQELLEIQRDCGIAVD